MKKVIETKQAPAAIGPYSQAVEINNSLFVSGQIPVDPSTGEIAEDIESQAKQSMTNLKAIIEEAGYQVSDIVRCTIFLTDLANFQAVNEIYGSFLEEPFPSRSCVQVAALPKGVQIEVDAIAVK
ncbi:RidA family protein [Aerococcus sanguinicola]|uniref:RidA family protein n=1 Tax=unclassified Aerococcus TaxID=2618060 RepID=UPI0008A35C0B|nr:MULTISPECIES: RidA family protein [unclassified Aerococcus]KAB0646410.1 RidA family protein [Aerococcus sanguinicola]MDK6233735.1 RidA family protein [Aerococcus sp. UMB10185]MDK6855910.1 RidA family protein [Aerococcus sp. UMB7533]MDK8502871.1 RidA family protein [Aerococcus sp. UMB1112A]OFN03735.1 reactive intermediate/imine deaminase [Aerococcus sp. HMSC062A02]